MNTQNIVDTLIKKLKSEGIYLQYYKSQNSNSHYLKLDYGVLKTIRISDHASKPHLKYRYNIQSNLKNNRYDKTSKRFFYPFSDLDMMFNQILSDRHDKISSYGEDKYEFYMNENIKDNRHKYGFWKDSKII